MKTDRWRRNRRCNVIVGLCIYIKVGRSPNFLYTMIVAATCPLGGNKGRRSESMVDERKGEPYIVFNVGSWDPIIRN